MESIFISLTILLKFITVDLIGLLYFLANDRIFCIIEVIWNRGNYRFIFKDTMQMDKRHTFVKGRFWYCPRAPFLTRERGKVVWVPSFDHFQTSIQFLDTLTSDGYFRHLWTI